MSLLQRLRNTLLKIKLQQADMPTFSSTYYGLKSFTVGICLALASDNCCCATKRDRSIKLYRNGQEQIDKRLDIVKLIRTSLDVELLKKLYLLPR